MEGLSTLKLFMPWHIRNIVSLCVNTVKGGGGGGGVLHPLSPFGAMYICKLPHPYILCCTVQL